MQLFRFGVLFNTCNYASHRKRQTSGPPGLHKKKTMQESHKNQMHQNMSISVSTRQILQQKFVTGTKRVSDEMEKK